MSGELKVSLGLREDGTVVHITELEKTERGLKCACVCAECGDALVARLGEVRQRHFAHHTDHNCTRSDESALHRFAKEVFSRHQRMKLPAVTVRSGYHEKDIAPAQYVHYTAAVVEQGYGNIRADVALLRPNGKPPLVVEILVTHAVDEAKLKELRVLGLPCLEIHLGGMFGLDEFDRAGLERMLIHQDYAKKWVCFPNEEQYRAELEQEVREEQEEQLRKEKAKREWLVRTEAKRRAQQDELVSEALQQAEAQRKEAELPDHPQWQKNSRILGLKTDNIPYYLNHPMKGEYLFTCHRAVWQSALFIPWVYNKRDENRSRDIHVEFATNNMHEQQSELLVKELYWAFRERPREFLGLADVIADYFGFLTRCGFVKHEFAYSGRVPYTQVYSCLLPTVFRLPPELNEPRYRFNSAGVVDTQTGEVIIL